MVKYNAALKSFHSKLTGNPVFLLQRDKDFIEVKLGDFGIAKFETEGTDTYVGSRNFLAPVSN